MKFDPKTKRFVLDSGRGVYAFAGVLGLLASGTADVDELVYGYDGYLERSAQEIFPDLTTEERAEIAKYMIDRWTKWGARGP